MERGILEILPRVGRTQVEVQLSRPPGEGSLPRREGGEKEDGAVGRVAASPECPRPTPPNPWLYHIQQRGFASGIKNLQKGGLSRIIQMSPQVITGYLHMVNLPRFFALSVTARSQEASLSSCWAGLDLLLQSGITGVTFPVFALSLTCSCFLRDSVTKEKGAVLKRTGPPDVESWLIRKDPDAGKD